MAFALQREHGVLIHHCAVSFYSINVTLLAEYRLLWVFVNNHNVANMYVVAVSDFSEYN